MSKAVNKLLAPIASLRLTVVLLAMSMVLIFAGTWAQIDKGIWQVMEEYFRSPFVFIRFDLFLPRGQTMPGGIPFPGGALLGGVLLVNLLAAHFVRFKFTWKRSGIFLTHAALILLILGEGFTAFSALETQMPIYEGQTIAWAQDIREIELAIIDESGENEDIVVTVSEDALIHVAKTGAAGGDNAIVLPDEVPFNLRVDGYMPNARVFRNPPMAPMPAVATTGVGRDLRAMEIPVANGVGDQQVSVPAAYVAPIDRETGEEIGGVYLVSPNLQTALYRNLRQHVPAKDREITMAMRFRRYYKDYALTLNAFHHDLYPGTTVPMNFASDIRLVDPRFNEDREVSIYMNHPLRYRGETFFQSGYLPDDQGTVLQVVDNPGWTVPYIACLIGGLGLTIHFMISLWAFLRRRLKVASAQGPGASA